MNAEGHKVSINSQCFAEHSIRYVLICACKLSKLVLKPLFITLRLSLDRRGRWGTIDDFAGFHHMVNQGPIPLQVEHVAVEFIVEPFRPSGSSFRSMKTSYFTHNWETLGGQECLNPALCLT